MAYFRKLPSGSTRVEIDLLGIRDSCTRKTKREAQLWADTREAEIRAGKSGQFPARTLTDTMDEYLKKVSSQKPGYRWEKLRLDVATWGAPDAAAWRDARLSKVSKGTVQREINLLKNVFTVSRTEWNWHNQRPFDGIKNPGDNPSRTRRTRWFEVRAICRWLGYRTGVIETKQQQTAFAYLLALRTAMRSQEILQLSDSTVDFDRRIATIGRHKTGHRTGMPKVVPLLPAALRLLEYVRGRGAYFTLDDAGRDALFRKARDSLMIKDLHFHDAKAEVLTRLARKVDVLTLSRISGNKDLRLLQETYYRETQEEVAFRVGDALRRAGKSPA
jgi:integrase